LFEDSGIKLWKDLIGVDCFSRTSTQQITEGVYDITVNALNGPFIGVICSTETNYNYSNSVTVNCNAI